VWQSVHRARVGNLRHGAGGLSGPRGAKGGTRQAGRQAPTALRDEPNGLAGEIGIGKTREESEGDVDMGSFTVCSFCCVLSYNMSNY